MFGKQVAWCRETAWIKRVSLGHVARQLSGHRRGRACALDVEDTRSATQSSGGDGLGGLGHRFGERVEPSTKPCEPRRLSLSPFLKAQRTRVWSPGAHGLQTPSWPQNGPWGLVSPGRPAPQPVRRGPAQTLARVGSASRALALSPQAPGWNCTSATGTGAASPPPCLFITATWKKSCWTPSTSPDAAAPRALTVTGGCQRTRAQGCWARRLQGWLTSTSPQPGLPTCFGGGPGGGDHTPGWS